jgi:DNA topoisomerase-6 subunit A
MVATRAKRPRRKTNQEVAGLLEGMADVVIGAARKKDNPSFDIPVRALSNVEFNPRKRFIEMGRNKTARQFFDLGMARKFMQTVLVADALMELQRQDNLSTSLREIYYRTKHTIEGTSENTFDDQDESDPIIEDLEVTLALLREELCVRAGDTGQIVGPVTLIEGGDSIDCTRMGVGGKAVPSIVEPGYVDIRKCNADFVLLIEKATQFNRLSEDKFWKKHNCILLTGGGQPPRGVRRLARRLHDEWRLPVLVLVDNDPWGYYIYSVVKQGSINLAFESQRMAIPDAKFVGLSSRDPETYGLPRIVGIKLNDKDIARAKEIANYPWFQKKEWQAEITYMLKSGLKYELDALAKKDFRFLTTDYLPQKLKKQKDWLD